MPASPPDNLTQAMGPAPMSINAARKSIVVRAPVTHVYEQWSQIEDLPKFITSLREIRRIDDSHFSYVWHPNGDDQHGVFQIVLQIPGRRIAWRTLSNGFMSGVVSFEQCSQEETEITLKIRSIFDPSNLSRRVEEYLHNFKRLVEDQGDRKTEKNDQ
jgi:uncharacterized membrane protein